LAAAIDIVCVTDEGHDDGHTNGCPHEHRLATVFISKVAPEGAVSLVLRKVAPKASPDHCTIESCCLMPSSSTKIGRNGSNIVKLTAVVNDQKTHTARFCLQYCAFLTE
jgi:hypothetical protein